MFTKMRAMLRDYFIPQQPNDYLYYLNEHGMFPYYDPAQESELLQNESEPSYVQPFPEKR
jgi:hypothetical protein